MSFKELSGYCGERWLGGEIVIEMVGPWMGFMSVGVKRAELTCIWEEIWTAFRKRLNVGRGGWRQGGIKNDGSQTSGQSDCINGKPICRGWEDWGWGKRRSSG